MTEVKTWKDFVVEQELPDAVVIGIGEFIGDSLTMLKLDRSLRMYNINDYYHKHHHACIKRCLTAERSCGWVWVSSIDVLQCFIDTALNENVDLVILVCNKPPEVSRGWRDTTKHHITHLTAAYAAKLMADGVDIREI